MNLKEKKFYKENLNEVLHATLNPYEPGVVRIHLIPAKPGIFNRTPSIVILNGRDIIPINFSWTVLLSLFIKEVDKYNGNEVNDEELTSIIDNTVNSAKKIYKIAKTNDLKSDLTRMINAFIDISEGKTPKEKIGNLSIGKYAKNMKSPHRMDLMVSSMIKENKWNCNQKCLHCYAAGQEYAGKNELTTEQWKDVIDKCKKAKIPQLTFTGGEPTIRKDLVELIDYSKWFVTRLNTNGALLTEELCEELYNASLDSVQVTFYSSNKDIHNKLVGADNYDKTLNGIKNALKCNLSVSINTPLCSINKDYVETLKFLKELGVKYVTCSGLIVTGNATKESSIETQLSENELLNILKEACKYAHDNLMEISFTSPGWLKESDIKKLNIDVPSCGACLSNMAIAPDGEVVPCQSWLDKNAGLGNILTDKWEKIWNNPECKKQRNFSAKEMQMCPLRKGGHNNEKN